MPRKTRVDYGVQVPASASAARAEARRTQRIAMAVFLLILVSALAVIHSTHACRALYAQLQELESTQWYLQEDYGRLMLEQSTWASHHRVESVARAQLGMSAPDLAHYRLIAK